MSVPTSEFSDDVAPNMRLELAGASEYGRIAFVRWPRAAAGWALGAPAARRARSSSAVR